jgi:5-methylcytosine-specific restriction protein A
MPGMQFGDQVMMRGNKAIRDHALHGKHLRLFQGVGGEVTYLGEFEYVTHRIKKAPASRGGGERDVFVFELRRVDA